MFTKITSTANDCTLTGLRLVLGTVFFAHGAQKLLGWFGGFGFEGTMGYFTDTMGLPWIVGFLTIVAEFFGSLALITGFLGRVGAVGIGAIMIGAVATVHSQFGFFANWTGQQAGEGVEYHLLVLAIAAVIAVKGSGAYSVDRALSGRTLTRHLPARSASAAI